MSGKGKTDLIVNGKRLDGRKPEELRPVKIQAGVLKRADGSCYLEWGENKVLAAVFGPRECLPKHEQDPYRARLLYRYNMAPFSVEDRKRPGPDRRSQEISKVSREALERVVFLENFPKASIDVFVEVLQADAGTRCAGLTAASVALADAGIPMRDIVVACAAGKVDNEIVLDVNKIEDNDGQADLPIAILPRTGEVLLMQLDGILAPEEYKRALQLAVEGCMKVNELQRNALREKYEKLADAGEQKE
ncbi:exosome complex exonuclease Rrp41 [Candidatus Micrarchaeota archaeon]|nr:exosome complex exonuclease Rrp41 [Candidatus Micrarchaeota archaeon]